MNTANTSSKTCFKCLKTKQTTEFYKLATMKDGFMGKCKTCTKEDVAANRLVNLERIREYDRERAKHPERLANAVAQTKRWRAEDKRRAKAHSMVARAIRDGRIEKTPCCVCGSDKSMAHHESYDNPLDVTWYCQPHHKDRHKQMALKGIEP